MMADVQDKYKTLKLLSRGSYGETYEANDAKTGKKVGLKVLKLNPGEDFRAVQQEVAIMADSSHPNIVKFYDSFQINDQLYIAMEFCDGGSLQAIYQALSVGLNELQIAFICKNVLEGLSYLHERNIMHRDIKAAKIMLTNDGHVKIAGFSIAAYLTTTMQHKRKTFVGSPYWMAPEVASSDKKGYSKQCDIWALGITAIELAEAQPPNFDLHPMRILRLMAKKNFKSPGLSHKAKWSGNFHDFLKQALHKDPKKRPSAQDLLKQDFVNRQALSKELLLPLITASKTPPPKVRTPIDDEDIDENESKDGTMKRVKSVKQLPKLEERKSISVSSGQLKQWFETPVKEKSEYVNTLSQRRKSTSGYENVNLPPVPLRRTKSNVQPKSEDAVSFSHSCFKLFDGCPLHLTCAAFWAHPDTQERYILLGAKEGLFSLLLLPDNPKPELKRASRRSCHWMQVVENTLVWLSGTHRLIAMSNLMILFQTESQRQENQERCSSNRDLTMIPDSSNCACCCIKRNHYTDQWYLFAVVPRGVLLMQWYEPISAFKMVMMCEREMPSPINHLEAFVFKEEEYPVLCFGVKESANMDGKLHFDTINLNISSEDDPKTCDDNKRDLKLVHVQQIREDAFLVGSDSWALLVDKQGVKKQMSSKITFGKKPDAMVFWENNVLSFFINGCEGRSLASKQVVVELVEDSRTFHLLGSHKSMTFFETHFVENPDGPSNIYLLEVTQTAREANRSDIKSWGRKASLDLLSQRFAEEAVSKTNSTPSFSQASKLEEQLIDMEEMTKIMEEGDRKIQTAEDRAAEAERRLQLTEQKLREYEEKLHKLESEWVVEKEEVQLTGPELGRGAWAKVTVATFRGVRVAAKCIHSQIISDYNIKLFKREMNVAARIRHPNLLQFIGATLEGELIILMELMFTTLRKELERRQKDYFFPIQQVASIGVDVAAALNYLHMMSPQPLIHRDISSANVLLEPLRNHRWKAKVSDYGTVKLLRELETACPGNPSYSAPEANDPSKQSPKMDIYSFGVLMLEVLSGEFPSPDQRASQLSSIFDKQLLSLVQQCLCLDQSARPAAGDIIVKLRSHFDQSA